MIDAEAAAADSSPLDPNEELEDTAGPSSPPKIQRRSMVESDGNGSTEKSAAFVGDVDETTNSPLLSVAPVSTTKEPTVEDDAIVAADDVVDPLIAPLQPPTALASSADPSDGMPVNEPATVAMEINGAVGSDKGVSSGDSMLEKFSLLSVQAREIKKSDTVSASISKKASKSSPNKRPVASPSRKQQSTPPSIRTDRTASTVHQNPSSLPRSAALSKVSNPTTYSSSQKHPTPRPAKSPTNRTHEASVPHYALPKDTTRSASSKEARDLHECSKKFKALPISPVVQSMLSPRSFLKKPSLQLSKSFHSLPPFKALPMPDFKAAHAKAITVPSPKQVTKPIPFYFRTEKRIMARKGIGSMISTSSFRFTKTNVDPTPSPRAVSTAKSPRKAQSAPAKPLPSSPSQRAAPKASPKKSRASLDVVSTKTPEISASPTLDQDLDRLLDDEDQAELDRLLNDGGHEGEVTFGNENYDAEADALNELLDEPLNLEPASHQSTPDSKPVAEQRSPDDVQAVNLGLFRQTADH
jgi:hypothetical protein